MKYYINVILLSTVVILVSTLSQAQIIKGPKNGVVASGAIVSTGAFSFAPSKQELIEAQKFYHSQNPESQLLSTPPDVMPALAPEGSNYIEDQGDDAKLTGLSRPVVQTSFQGIPSNLGAGFPPDPIMAVGPEHVMVLVNSSFRIYSKTGQILKTITASSWFNSIAPGSGPNDPQVLYDHFAKRWVMQWMTSPTATEHYHMFSVSDDSSPIGTWYNWKTPSFRVGDSSIGSWGDYPAIGYDSFNIYLMSRQFTFSGGTFQYCKLRILDKASLYANTAGQITFKDFWDLRDPVSTSIAPDNIRPANVWGEPGKYWLMNSSPFSSGTYFTLWTISNPGTTPTIIANNIAVTAYSSPPNADQLGGSTLLIQGGQGRIRANVIYRDGSLWAVHNIASGQGNAYSAVRYLRFDPFQKTVLEDVSMGKQGFWHIYPAITVTKDTSVIISYSRSGLTEYIGAFTTGRNDIDAPGLAPSVLIKAGEANYVQSDGSRNRWGDYMGTGLDPTDQKSAWTFTEYAGTSNSWNTWVAKVQMGPFPGVSANYSATHLNFGSHEAGTQSDTLRIKITNDGNDTLVISNITTLGSNFQLVNPPTLPLHVSYYDSAMLSFIFSPGVAGNLTDSIVITSNNASSSTTTVSLQGRGFTIAQAERGVLYAVSGAADGGRLLRVDMGTGAITPVGATGYNSIVNMRVNPITHELIGLYQVGTKYQLMRINTALGDAYPFVALSDSNLRGMEYLPDGTLYIGTRDGSVLNIDMGSGEAIEAAFSGIPISGLAINPNSGELWSTIRPLISGKDKVYKIAIPSGDTTRVGSTGFGVITTDIIFDQWGNLFGLTGSGATVNKLIRIDTSNAVGTVVGSMGITSVQALALWPDSAVSGVHDNANSIPNTYALEQNYPNPFNPSTEINFQLPQSGFVSLKVYDVLGKEVASLIQKDMKAGKYFATWNAANVPSGMYFYRLTSNKFSATKKMLLVK